jgi:hypothetical protein
VLPPACTVSSVIRPPSRRTVVVVSRLAFGVTVIGVSESGTGSILGGVPLWALAVPAARASRIAVNWAVMRETANGAAANDGRMIGAFMG